MAMKIKDFLTASNVAIDVPASDKTALLKELAARAAACLNLPVDMLSTEIERRDELGSTGIGGGVCLPHARLRQVKKPFGLFVRLKSPIEFDAIDGRPVDLVFLLMLPASSQLEQLNALAAVARRLRDPVVLQKLRDAATSGDLYTAVSGHQSV